METNERTLNSGIKVSDSDYPPPTKKYKTGEKAGNNTQDENEGRVGEKGSTYASDKGGSKSHMTEISLSTPPKIGWNRRHISQRGNEEKDKVYIPKDFGEGKSESETFSDRIKNIEGFGDIGQGSSKQNDEVNSQQI